MRKTILCLATLALLFSGAHAASEEAEAFGPDSVPAILKPYMKGSVFTPGNYEWMRGKFADASEEQKAAYNTVFEWREGCSQREKSRVRTQLASAGYPKVNLDFLPITTAFCAQFAVEPNAGAFTKFEDFKKVYESVEPILRTLTTTISIAESHGGVRTAELAAQLNRRPMEEQILRIASMWARQTSDEYTGPILTSEQGAVFGPLIWAQIARADRSNTNWLKEVVADDGWPAISKVGKDASSKAWLLAQHADHDPVWQLKVLKLMEPLVEEGDVSKRNYAYLYDRVMLKLVGTQRFATQVTCKDGERVARPLENAAELAELRVSVDLEPFEEYLTWFSAPCPEPE